VSEFRHEGIPSIGLFSDEFKTWLDDSSKTEIQDARGLLDILSTQSWSLPN
jgi:two-component system, OmpR family, flagellar system response regulator FtcR